jgi:hypothetical protein
VFPWTWVPQGSILDPKLFLGQGEGVHVCMCVCEREREYQLSLSQPRWMVMWWETEPFIHSVSYSQTYVPLLAKQPLTFAGIYHQPSSVNPNLYFFMNHILSVPRKQMCAKLYIPSFPLYSYSRLWKSLKQIQTYTV